MFIVMNMIINNKRESQSDEIVLYILNLFGRGRSVNAFLGGGTEEGGDVYIFFERGVERMFLPDPWGTTFYGTGTGHNSIVQCGDGE